MDYSKLSKVTDDVTKGRKPSLPVSSDGLELSEQRSALDDIEIRSKVKDDAKKVKLVILDSVQIEKILKSSRESRRAFLSQLTDSQRRRFLDAAKNIKKLKDSGFSERLALLQADNLLANFVFDPTKFNKDAVKALLEEPQFDSLDDSVRDLVNLVLTDSFGENEESEKALERYQEVCKAASLDSSFMQALAFMEDKEEEVPEEEIIEEIPEDVVETITESAKFDASKLLDKDANIFDLCDSTIYKFVKRGFSFSKVKEIYDKAWRDSLSGIVSDATDSIFKDKYGFSAQEIIDAGIMDKKFTEVLSDIEEAPVEEPVEEEIPKEVSVIELLSEALTEFLNGDSSKLEELSKKTVELEIEEPSEEDEEPDESEESVEESSEEIDEELLDASKFASSILSGSVDQKLLDSFRGKIDVLNKYDFSSKGLSFGRSIVDAVTVVNPPLNHQEFQSISPVVPEVLAPLIEQYPKSEVPPVISWEIPENEDCVLVNNLFKYYPYKSTLEELKAQLSTTEDPEGLSKIIGSVCCSIRDAFHVAAISNNLNFIDTKFYKKNLVDCVWSFDEIPDCLKELVMTPGSVKITITPSEKSIDIYGQSFDLI